MSLNFLVRKSLEHNPELQKEIAESYDSTEYGSSQLSHDNIMVDTYALIKVFTKKGNCKVYLEPSKIIL